MRHTNFYNHCRSIYVWCRSRFKLVINYLFHEFIMRIPSRRVRHFFIRRKLCNVGKNTSFLMNLEIRIGENITIGSNTVINNRVLLDGRGGKLTIGNNVDIAQETNIWTMEHDVNDNFHAAIGGDVTIHDYVWIASRVTILPGVTIGRGAVVATNSVVTKDVSPMTIVGGIPAKVIGLRKNELLYHLNYSPLFK